MKCWRWKSNVKLILESKAFNVSIKSLFCLEYLILSQFIKVSEEDTLN